MELKDAKAFAISKGGKCLSTGLTFIGPATILKFKCERGHVWETLGRNTRRGHWCKQCARGLSTTFADLKEIAESKGGVVLSEPPAILKNLSRVKLQCANGHKWETQARLTFAGFWCHVCSGLDFDLYNKSLKIAKKKGGSCLTPTYLGASKKHKWECKQGHTWQSSVRSVINGIWCPKCKSNSSKLKK